MRLVRPISIALALALSALAASAAERPNVVFILTDDQGYGDLACHAGTPAGLFLSKDHGETWETANLVLQFTKNRRRELGGASFIDAYWRARHYGFLKE